MLSVNSLTNRYPFCLLVDLIFVKVLVENSGGAISPISWGLLSVTETKFSTDENSLELVCCRHSSVCPSTYGLEA